MSSATKSSEKWEIVESKKKKDNIQHLLSCLSNSLTYESLLDQFCISDEDKSMIELLIECKISIEYAKELLHYIIEFNKISNKKETLSDLDTYITFTDYFNEDYLKAIHVRNTIIPYLKELSQSNRVKLYNKIKRFRYTISDCDPFISVIIKK